MRWGKWTASNKSVLKYKELTDLNGHLPEYFYLQNGFKMKKFGNPILCNSNESKIKILNYNLLDLKLIWSIGRNI